MLLGLGIYKIRRTRILMFSGSDDKVIMFSGSDVYVRPREEAMQHNYSPDDAAVP